MSIVSGVDISQSPLADGITSSLTAAPELLSTPGLALDAGGSLDPTTFAPVVSHVATTQATTQALAQEKVDAQGNTQGNSGGGFFHELGHIVSSIPGAKSIEHAIGGAAKYLAAPLHEIQRDYRFIHLVWTKNGSVAGVLATLGVVAGAAAGGYVGGQEGAILGGEGAAALERLGAGAFGGHGKGYTANGQTNYNEGLAATAALSADPHIKISLGRDYANALGQLPGLHTLRNTDKGFGKLASGAEDATADWELDPAVALAKFKTGLKFNEYGTGAKAAAQSRVAASKAEAAAGGPWTKVQNAAQRLYSGDLLRTMQADGAAQFFDRVSPGIQATALNSEQLTRLYNAPGAAAGLGTGGAYRRALTHIGSLDSGQIAALYPELDSLAPNVLKDSAGEVTLKGLGDAKSAEEAHQVFVNVLENKNFADRLGSLAVVPTRTLTRSVGSHIAEWARNIDSHAATTSVETPEGAASAFQVRAQPRSTLTAAVPNALAQIAQGNFGAAKDAVTGAIARKISTFSGYVPFALERHPDLRIAAGKTFTVDPTTGQAAPYAVRGILSSMRFSMGEHRGRYWADQFLNANDLADQKRIWAEAQFEMLKAAGLPDDEKLVQDVRQQLADLSTGPMDGPNQFYGFSPERGADVALQPVGDTQVARAIWADQASPTFSFPNFTDVKQAQRQLQGAIKTNYGRFDDLASRAYVGAIFKPLALANAGFGLRVAIAEAIPQAIRVGALQHLSDVVNTKAAKLDYKLSDGEDVHILAAAAHALSDPENYKGPTFSGKQVFQAQRRVLLAKGEASILKGVNGLLNDPIARSRAIDLIMRHDGHIAMGAARTGESTGGWHMDQDPASKAKQAMSLAKSEYKYDPRISTKPSSDFGVFTPGDDHFDGNWHLALSKVSQQRPGQLIAQDLLGSDRATAIRGEARRLQDVIDEHPAALEAYTRESKVLSAYSAIKAQKWNAEDFAANRVDALRGLVTGADGTVHTDLLNQIGRGEKPAIEDLAEIEAKSRPAQIYGAQRVHYVGNNLMQRIVSNGFAKIVDPIINGLSRDPLYFNEFSRQMDLMDPAIKAGTLDEDTAMRIAETRSVVGMLPKIHNTALRSQFSVLARNYMPFYFAQEQALRRAGKLVATNPSALRQFQLIHQGLNDPGFVHTDDQGNKFFIFPGVGALAGTAAFMGNLFPGGAQFGLPLTVQGSMSSLNTILPDFQMPGVSPLVSLPLNYLTGFFPELSATAKELEGPAGFHQAAVDALLPHPIVKAAWRAMNANERDASFANAMFTSMQTSLYNGTAPAPDASDAVRAAWINRMKNNARSTFIVKGLVGLISPLAPSVSNQTEKESGFRSEFFTMVKKSGYAAALQTFLKEHGTSAISYTVAHSQPTYPGAYIPYTNQAVNAINGDLKPLLNSSVAAGAAFLVPQAQGPGDVQTIHSELVRNYLRQQDTPQDFLNAVDIALGNNAIDPALKVHETALAQVANDPQGRAAENKQWSDFMHVQHLNNPTWYDYWASPQRTNFAYQAWANLREIYAMTDKSGNPLPITQTQQGQVVGQLLADYANHALAMSQTTSSAARTVERANWKQFLQDTGKANPLAYSVINAVFDRLDSAGVTPNGTVA